MSQTDILNDFIELQSDFYFYMITIGNIAPKTGRDYLTRLKFLASKYTLNTTITTEYIEYILSQEEIERSNRTKYSTRHAMNDFKSCLNKFHDFVKSDFSLIKRNLIQAKIKEIESNQSINVTQKSQLINARIGQGVFRENLINYWKGCSICGLNYTCFLIASHIKPWRVSNNEERLDVFNGLLLLPNYDKLFDLGYISFSQNGNILISRVLDKATQQIFNINKNTSLTHIDNKHTKYFKYHNEYCFIP